MSALFVALICVSAVGLYYSARLEGYCEGLRRREKRLRQQMEEHQHWVRTAALMER